MELVKLKLQISSKYIHHVPKLRVSINEIVIFDTEVKNTSTIIYPAVLELNQHYSLNMDCDVQDNSSLIIESIHFDNMEYTHLLGTDEHKSYQKFVCEDNSQMTFDRTIGRTGRGTIKFTSPFYAWMLDNDVLIGKGHSQGHATLLN